MIDQARLIEVFKPVAPLIIGIDARAVTVLSQRKGDYAGLDRQPVAAAMANERRAIVGTELRTSMTGFGWELNEEHLQSGAYEWFLPDVAIRLSKTTPQSRKEDAAAGLGLQGIQGALFAATPDPDVERDAVLIRLMGNIFDGAWVDVVALKNDGRRGYEIPMQTIAKASTEQAVADEMAEADVSLPRVALPKARGTNPE